MSFISEPLKFIGDLFTPDPEEPNIPSGSQLNLTEDEEDAKRAEASELEKRKKRRVALKRIGTTPTGALVPQGNLGKSNLLGGGVG